MVGGGGCQLKWRLLEMVISGVGGCQWSLCSACFHGGDGWLLRLLMIVIVRFYVARTL